MFGLLMLFAAALALLLALLALMLAYEMRHPPRHTAAYALAKGLPCDPGDLNLAFEEWRLDRPGGASLPVWDIRIDKPAGSDMEMRPPMTAVFIHGWGHSRIDALTRIECVQDLCDRIVLYDLRGHGEAAGLSPLGQGEADDLLALLERLGDDRLALIGHSMGAVIAIRAAADAARRVHPVADRIAGIIAYGAYCGFHESLRGRLRVAGYPARPLTDLALLLHRCGGLAPLSLHDEDIAALPCAALMIHGCEDRVAPIANVRRLARGAAHLTLHEIAAAAHSDIHQLDPQRHAAMVRDFLLRIRSPRPASVAIGPQVSA